MATTCLTPLELDNRPSEVQPTPEQALESENPVNGDDDPPATAVNALERWNHPRHNIARLIATFWSFIVSGANDAAYGALIPYLESYYGLSYTIVSLVFLSPLGGYVLTRICQWYDGHWFLARDYSRQSGVGFCDASCGGENLRFGLHYFVNCIRTHVMASPPSFTLLPWPSPCKVSSWARYSRRWWW